MTAANLLIVTGTFDKDQGKASYFGTNIYEAFKSAYDEDTILFLNGGNLTSLDETFQNIGQFKVIVWMPLIDNSEDKYLGDIKKKNTTALLIQSKRNDSNKYTNFDLVKRMFAAHSNLCLEISKVDGMTAGYTYNFKLLDPLGNIWYDGPFIKVAADRMTQVVQRLLSMTRYPSRQVTDNDIDKDVDRHFLEAVKSYGWRFSTLINHAINKQRFLGNASTRCMRGFPAQKNDNVILVSKRNVEKESISAQEFVPVNLQGNEVCYYGDHKPSVDSAVQIMLFNYYPYVKYIIHGHTYIPGCIYTAKHVPCGCIEEFQEITQLVPDQGSYNFSINLVGHGCIILANDLDYIAGLPMVARDFPEDLTKHQI